SSLASLRPSPPPLPTPPPPPAPPPFPSPTLFRSSPALASQPEFRNTPHCLGNRPCALSHAFRSSIVTAASASLRALSRKSITARSEEHTSELQVTDQSRMPSSA